MLRSMGELIDPSDHLGLVHHITRKISLGDALEYEDAASIGTIALIEAARKYDSSKGAFAIYASIRIRGAIIDEMRRIIGRHRAKPEVWSLDRIRENPNSNFDVEDITVGWQYWGDTSDERYAYKTLNSLQPREQEIVKFLATGMTLKQVAEELGCSASRVGQIVCRMRKRLRAAA